MNSNESSQDKNGVKSQQLNWFYQSIARTNEFMQHNSTFPQLTPILSEQVDVHKSLHWILQRYMLSDSPHRSSIVYEEMTTQLSDQLLHTINNKRFIELWKYFDIQLSDRLMYRSQKDKAAPLSSGTSALFYNAIISCLILWDMEFEQWKVFTNTKSLAEYRGLYQQYYCHNVQSVDNDNTSMNETNDNIDTNNNYSIDTNSVYEKEEEDGENEELLQYVNQVIYLKNDDILSTSDNEDNNNIEIENYKTTDNFILIDEHDMQLRTLQQWLIYFVPTIENIYILKKEGKMPSQIELNSLSSILKTYVLPCLINNSTSNSNCKDICEYVDSILTPSTVSDIIDNNVSNSTRPDYDSLAYLFTKHLFSSQAVSVGLLDICPYWLLPQINASSLLDIYQLYTTSVSEGDVSDNKKCLSTQAEMPSLQNINNYLFDIHYKNSSLAINHSLFSTFEPNTTVTSDKTTADNDNDTNTDTNITANNNDSPSNLNTAITPDEIASRCSRIVVYLCNLQISQNCNVFASQSDPNDDDEDNSDNEKNDGTLQNKNKAIQLVTDKIPQNIFIHQLYNDICNNTLDNDLNTYPDDDINIDTCHNDTSRSTNNTLLYPWIIPKSISKYNYRSIDICPLERISQLPAHPITIFNYITRSLTYWTRKFNDNVLNLQLAFPTNILHHNRLIKFAGEQKTSVIAQLSGISLDKRETKISYIDYLKILIIVFSPTFNKNFELETTNQKHQTIDNSDNSEANVAEDNNSQTSSSKINQVVSNPSFPVNPNASIDDITKFISTTFHVPSYQEHQLYESVVSNISFADFENDVFSRLHAQQPHIVIIWMLLMTLPALQILNKQEENHQSDSLTHHEHFSIPSSSIPSYLIEALVPCKRPLNSTRSKNNIVPFHDASSMSILYATMINSMNNFFATLHNKYNKCIISQQGENVNCQQTPPSHSINNIYQELILQYSLPFQFPQFIPSGKLLFPYKISQRISLTNISNAHRFSSIALFQRLHSLTELNVLNFLLSQFFSIIPLYNDGYTYNDSDDIMDNTNQTNDDTSDYYTDQSITPRTILQYNLSSYHYALIALLMDNEEFSFILSKCVHIISQKRDYVTSTTDNNDKAISTILSHLFGTCSIFTFLPLFSSIDLFHNNNYLQQDDQDVPTQNYFQVSHLACASTSHIPQCFQKTTISPILTESSSSSSDVTPSLTSSSTQTASLISNDQKLIYYIPKLSNIITLPSPIIGQIITLTMYQLISALPNDINHNNPFLKQSVVKLSQVKDQALNASEPTTNSSEMSETELIAQPPHICYQGYIIPTLHPLLFPWLSTLLQNYSPTLSVSIQSTFNIFYSTLNALLIIIKTSLSRLMLLKNVIIIIKHLLVILPPKYIKKYSDYEDLKNHFLFDKLFTIYQSLQFFDQYTTQPSQEKILSAIDNILISNIYLLCSNRMELEYLQHILSSRYNIRL